MEAPEKIYLVPFGRPIVEPLPKEGGSEVETIWSRSPYGNKDAGNIEYTSTDAFIEKAAEWIKNKAENYIVDTPLCSYFDYKRAVEDFIDVMKGE